jgi:hypothetical protein
VLAVRLLALRQGRGLPTGGEQDRRHRMALPRRGPAGAGAVTRSGDPALRSSRGREGKRTALAVSRISSDRATTAPPCEKNFDPEIIDPPSCPALDHAGASVPILRLAGLKFAIGGQEQSTSFQWVYDRVAPHVPPPRCILRLALRRRRCARPSVAAVPFLSKCRAKFMACERRDHDDNTQVTNPDRPASGRSSERCRCRERHAGACVRLALPSITSLASLVLPASSALKSMSEHRTCSRAGPPKAARSRRMITERKL